jgi:hypothetical protein
MVLLLLGSLLSGYQTLYCAWMVSHPLYTSSDWVARFYLRLGTTILTAVGGIILLIVLVRTRPVVRGRRVAPKVADP